MNRAERTKQEEARMNLAMNHLFEDSEYVRTVMPLAVEALRLAYMLDEVWYGHFSQRIDTVELRAQAWQSAQTYLGVQEPFGPEASRRFNTKTILQVERHVENVRETCCQRFTMILRKNRVLTPYIEDANSTLRREYNTILGQILKNPDQSYKPEGTKLLWTKFNQEQEPDTPFGFPVERFALADGEGVQNVQ